MELHRRGTLVEQNCPKCGSDKVTNDQCLKCGIVISKFLQISQNSAEPVSYVAASQAHKEYSYTISKDHIDYAEAPFER